MELQGGIGVIGHGERSRERRIGILCITPNQDFYTSDMDEAVTMFEMLAKRVTRGTKD